MDFLQLCEKRYSVRDFLDLPVEQEKLDAILEAIRLAPTGLNQQPYMIFVIQSEEALNKVTRAKATLYGAKTVLVFCYQQSKIWCNRYSGEEGILQDIGIVAATALYAATAQEVGSCYVCNFDPKALAKELQLAEDLKPACLVLLGYASEQGVPSVRHSTRRALTDFVIKK